MLILDVIIHEYQIHAKAIQSQGYRVPKVKEPIDKQSKAKTANRNKTSLHNIAEYSVTIIWP